MISDCSAWVAFLLVNAIIIYYISKVVLVVYGSDDALEMVCHVVLYYCYAVIAAGQVLGFIGCLNWAFYSAVMWLLCSCCYACCASRYINTSSSLFDKNLLKWRGCEIALVSLICVYVAMRICEKGVVEFPYEWDTLMYHLPCIDQWLISGDLFSRKHWIWSCPGNNELFELWFVCFFSGDFFYCFAWIPIVALLMISILEIGRTILLSVFFRMLLLFFVISNFVVFFQIQTAKNDVAVAAFFLCAVNYILKYSRSRRKRDLLAAFMAIGILAGIKYYAIGYAAVLIAVVAFENAPYWCSGSRNVLLWFLCLAVFIGGFWSWYLRNIIVTGYPFFPLGAAIPEDSIANYYPGMIGSTFIGNLSVRVVGLYLAAVYNLGGPIQYIAVILFPVAMAINIASCIRKKEWPVKKEIKAILLLLIGCLGVFVVTPFAVEAQPGSLDQMDFGFTPVRYSFCFLCMNVIACFRVLMSIVRSICLVDIVDKAKWIKVMLMSVGSAIVILMVVWQLRVLEIGVGPLYTKFVNNSVLILIAYINVIGLLSLALKIRLVVLFGLVSGVCLQIAGVYYASDKWHREFASYYDLKFVSGSVGCLDEAIIRGEKICVLDEHVYPFFGSRRKGNVRQVSPMRSVDWWKKNIQKEGFEYIFIRMGQKKYYNDWLHLIPYFYSDKNTFIEVCNSQDRYAVIKVCREKYAK